MLVHRSRKAERYIKERRKRAGQTRETGQDGARRRSSSYYINLQKMHSAAGRTPDDPSDNTKCHDLPYKVSTDESHRVLDSFRPFWARRPSDRVEPYIM